MQVENKKRGNSRKMKESENNEKELQQRQTKRAEQMVKLAKVSGPQDIVDETNFERLGFQIIRTELWTLQ